MRNLTSEEIKKKLAELKGWCLDEKKSAIGKSFKFEDFTSTVCFFNRVAEIAELENHHPDLHLTNYRNLKIVLSTHSAGGLTRKDFKLATQIEEVFREA